MKVGIVGLGLIGGSIALDVKANGFANEVIGTDANSEHITTSVLLNLVDSVVPLETLCTRVDLVVLAIPVSAIVQVLPTVLDLISENTIVTDVGSTKKKILDSVKDHPRRRNYVASHPMAGTEFSGPNAAMLGLFRNKAAVICDAKDSAPRAVKIIEEFYQALEMRLIHMAATDHDLHAAYVSHLSHITSFALANTVLEKEKNVDAIFELASGGFESTVRLAKSSPEMWTPIFEQNREFIIEALGAYIERLQFYQASLQSQDYMRTKEYMQHANQITRVLEKIGGTRGPKK